MQYDDKAERYGYEGEMTPLKCDKLQRYSLDVDYEENVVAVPNNDGNYMESSEVDAAIAELKNKLEDAEATAYAESVDAGMRERRLRRALWSARAERAKARKNYWYARSCHEGDKDLWSIDGSAVKYIGCIKRTNFDWLKIWSEVEIKCSAKAEEYE